MDHVQPHQTRKRSVRVFFLLSTHRDLRDVSTGLLSRVKLLCVPLKCQPEVRWSGPTQASSHAPVTDSPSLSSSPQVMLVGTCAMLLVPSVGKIGVKRRARLEAWRRCSAKTAERCGLLSRSCRTLHPDVVHLFRNPFSCEAPDAPSRKLES